MHRISCPRNTTMTTRVVQLANPTSFWKTRPMSRTFQPRNVLLRKNLIETRQAKPMITIPLEVIVLYQSARPSRTRRHHKTNRSSITRTQQVKVELIRNSFTKRPPTVTVTIWSRCHPWGGEEEHYQDATCNEDHSPATRIILHKRKKQVLSNHFPPSHHHFHHHHRMQRQTPLIIILLQRVHPSRTETKSNAQSNNRETQVQPPSVIVVVG
jgi:hypothetical protein